VDEAFRRAARDRRSGAAEIAVAVARALPALGSRREVLAAARVVLRAHPAMGPLWRMFGDALERSPAESSRRGLERLAFEADAIVHAARWVFTARRSVVVTHSASSSVTAALRTARSRVRAVICTESRPGEEGARLARRLSREGFDARVVPDAEMARVCASVDLALTGADAVTDEGAINKVGTHLLALAARENEAPFYVLAGTSKLLPQFPLRAALYESTPLSLLSGVVSERGTMSAAAVRRAVRRIEVPAELLRLVA
jgi:translation initiation factor eIF-2B subunit delta